MCRPEHVKRTEHFLFGFPSPDGCYKVRSYDKTKANQPKGPFSRGKDKKKKKKKKRSLKGDLQGQDLPLKLTTKLYEK